MVKSNPLVSDEKYVKLREVADLLGVEYETVREWTAKFPDFPALRLPKGIRVRPSEVVAWLDQFQKEGGANG
jgi:hypothetical protein